VRRVAGIEELTEGLEIGRLEIRDRRSSTVEDIAH
jgi:hypothetical protein